MKTFKDFIIEASYVGNLGLIELVKFHQLATKQQSDEVKQLISNGQHSAAWRIVQDVTNIHLQGDQFNESIESDDLYPIKEGPLQKKRREYGGYQLMTIDAQKFKNKFEQQHGEPLNWNKHRLERLRELYHDGVKIDDHPLVGINHFNKVDVTDGRHRITHAAELGKKIRVAIHPDDIEKMREHLK